MRITLSRLQKIILSILSGVLLGFAFPSYNILPFAFIGFVPILFVINDLVDRNSKSVLVFLYSFLAISTWTLIDTWWIKNAALIGAISAIVVNGIIFSCGLTFYAFTKRNIGAKPSGFAFIIFWLALEYLHMSNWDLSFPWLTLGNVFADYPSFIQWYDKTGVLGGSLLVLIINMLMYVWGKNFLLKKYPLPGRIIHLMGIILLIVISWVYSISVEPEMKKENGKNCIIVQPNFDPYSEKFSLSPNEILSSMLAQLDEQISDSTDYLVFPETALTKGEWEHDFSKSWQIKALRAIVKKFPQLKIITGLTSYKILENVNIDDLPISARKYGTKYYEAFNTAILIDSSAEIQTYHKSKLVAGVEQMPFVNLLSPLKKLAMEMGGTSGVLGTQEERTVFAQEIAPVICYESVYGEYVGDYIKNGAKIIAIITNDAWWGDTPGYKQHLAYARLRAIETRRPIIRSANTGISAIINQCGEIEEQRGWNERSIIKGNIFPNTNVTFYSKHGDFIGRTALGFGVLLFLSVIVRRVKQKSIN